MKIVTKTFCCTRIHGADLLKYNLAKAQWVRYFSEFFAMVVETTRRHDGTMVKSLGDGTLTAFARLENALQAAIDLQEALNSVLPYSETGIACKVGLATGQTTILSVDDQEIDYLGWPVDVADRLCERAHGNAILLHYPHTNPADAIPIYSQAGISQQRAPQAYFSEQPPCQLPGIKEIVHCYSVFWQAIPGNYLTTNPAQECRPFAADTTNQEATYFGKVSTFKKERGFGFIQYYTEDHVYREIYFHMTYVVNQTPIQEQDPVQFVIKPGKDGRPQACSILVMGSRLRGQVESLDPSGSSYISIRNQASEVIRFFILPQEAHTLPLQVGNNVEFTVGSGSDTEGLVATDMILHRAEETSNQTGTGDNLPLGSTEQAIITVYFTEKGYGFAKCRRNNIYVHVSELLEPEHIPHPGDMIEFKVTPGRDGTYRANTIRLIKKTEPV